MDLRLPKQRMMVHPASFWKRLLALIIDILIVEMIIFTPFAPLFPTIEEDAFASVLNGSFHISGVVYVIFFLIFILSWLYFSIFQAALGQTPAMMFLGMSIEGNRSIGRCLLRNLYVFPVFPFILLWIIEPLTLALRHRTWLESLTGVRVVERIPLT